MNIEKIQYAALRMAKNRGHSKEDAEDFSQYCLLNLIQGRKTRIHNLFIDWMRLKYGHSNQKNNEMRRNEKNSFLEINEETLGLVDREEYSTFNQYRNTLEGKERAILTFLYEWDMSLEELADAFGVTTGRMCQCVSLIKTKLKGEM